MTTPDPLMSLAPPEPRSGQQQYEAQRAFLAGCVPTVKWGDIGDDDRARWEERAQERNRVVGAVGVGPTDPVTGVALEYHADGEVTRWEPTTGDSEVAPDGS